MRNGILFALLAFAAASFAIDGCSLISSPGTYELTGELSGASIPVATPYDGSLQLACIAITSSDVVLDCGGHSIAGDGTENSFGIVIQNADNSTIENVTVKNCVVSGYPAADLFALELTGGEISDNAFQNGGGAVLYGGSSNSLSGDNASNDTGFLLKSSTDNVLSGNSVTDGYGFRLMDRSDRNSLLDSTVDGESFGIALEDSGNATISGTVMSLTGSGAGGLLLDNSSYNTVTDTSLDGEDYCGVCFTGESVSNNVFSDTLLSGNNQVFGWNLFGSLPFPDHLTGNAFDGTTIAADSNALGVVLVGGDTLDNVMTGTSVSGDSVLTFIVGSFSDTANNTISDTSISADDFFLFTMQSEDGDILGNTVNSLQITAISTEGIALFADNAIGNSFTDISITSDSTPGAFIQTANDFSGNTLEGIRLQNLSPDATAVGGIVVLAGNDFTGNRISDSAISADGAGADGLILIAFNNSKDNLVNNTDLSFGYGTGFDMESVNEFSDNKILDTEIKAKEDLGFIAYSGGNATGNLIEHTSNNASDVGELFIFHSDGDLRNNTVSDTALNAGEAGFIEIGASNDMTGNDISDTIVNAEFFDEIAFDGSNFSDNRISNTRVNATEAFGMFFEGTFVHDNDISDTSVSAKSTFGIAFEGSDVFANNRLRDTRIDSYSAFGVDFESDNFTGNSISGTDVSSVYAEDPLSFEADNVFEGNNISDTTVAVHEAELGLIVASPVVTNNRFENAAITIKKSEFAGAIIGPDFELDETTDVSNNTFDNLTYSGNGQEAGIAILGDPVSSGNNRISNIASSGESEMAGIMVSGSGNLLENLSTSGSNNSGLMIKGSGNSVSRLTSSGNGVSGFYEEAQGGPASTLSGSFLYGNPWEIIQNSSGGQFTIINTSLGKGRRQVAISLSDVIDAGYMITETSAPDSPPPGIPPGLARYLKVDFDSGGPAETQIDSLTLLDAASPVYTWNYTYWVPTPNQAQSGNQVTVTSLVNITSDDIYGFKRSNT